MEIDREAAKKAGVSKSYIWEVENTDNNPSLDKAEQIASAFGMELWRVLKIIHKE